MLKVISSLLCFILVSCSSQEPFQRNVSFDRELLPSCYVDAGDGYWSWRDAKGVSLNAEEDLKNLLMHSGIFNSVKHKLSYERLEVALCDEVFLLSSRLAIVMNFYGKNLHPKDWYYHVLRGLSKSGEDVLVDAPRLIKIMTSSLQELESRF